jgi:hypothetical protein
MSQCGRRSRFSPQLNPISHFSSLVKASAAV